MLLNIQAKRRKAGERHVGGDKSTTIKIWQVVSVRQVLLGLPDVRDDFLNSKAIPLFHPDLL